ncbi:uncharacterized protein LOC122052646 [Zingiber officinale]|uniref:Uncharacterized protein n=1 Tax=Zingiber officinale TaxID=94328 RepID=A0A8J5M4C4_ZINOF|nr:uncharacterized protein LOC122052646 [Zingiber officinale]KAG6531643.1 hypothetical protein ZIOFF_005459 [Zingiber officinale]
MLMDSEALKDFSFDKIGASESDEMEIIEMGSLIKLEEVASGGQEVCRRAPSIGCNYYPEGCDGAFIELIDGMEVCPATPSPDSESLDLSFSSDQSEEREAVSIAQTPLQNTFDPFAPAKEDLAVAPMKKTLKRIQIPHLRKLKFYEFLDSTRIECHVPEDGHLSELLSQSFFELIVSCQLQEISANNLLDHEQHSKYPNTPLSLPLLTGVAETCPPAPKREPARSTKLDPGICRQLDFPDDDMAG